MSVNSRIRSLSEQHTKLDNAIQDEQKRPASDPIRLRKLKREKLRIKEEMSALSA